MPDAQLFQLPARQPGKLARNSVRLLVLLLAGLTLLTLIGIYAASQHLYHSRLDNLERHARTQAHNLEDRLTQNLDLLHVHLDALIRQQPDAAIDISVLQTVLNQLQDKLKYVRSISVVDVGGQLFMSTNPGNTSMRIDLGPQLPPLQADNAGRLRFGMPWSGSDFADGARLDASPASDVSSTFFPVTLVLPETPQWTFLIALDPGYFLQALGDSASSEAISGKVVLADGTLLFSSSAHDRPGSRLHTSAPLDGTDNSSSAVSARWKDAAGRQQLASVLSSSNYPLQVLIETPADDVLRHWRQDSKTFWLISGISLSALMLLGALLAYRTSRILQQEQKSLKKNLLAARVFRHSSDLIAIAGSDKRIIAVNPAYERVTGFSAQEVVGTVIGSNWVAPEHLDHYNSLWTELETQDSWDGMITETHKDGHPVAGWLQVNVIRDQQSRPLYYIAVLKDMSRLHTAEASLHKLSQAVEQSSSSIVITTPGAKIEYVNPQFLRISGYTLDEVIGACPSLLKSGLTPPETYRNLWQNISSGKTWHGEFINKSKDNKLFHERAVISPIQDKQGNLTGYLAVKHDISSEKEADHTMRLAVRIIDSIPEGVLICNAMQRIISINPAFTQITGYTNAEVLGRRPDMLGVPERNIRAVTGMRRALARRNTWHGELHARHKDGHDCIISTSVSLLHDQNGNISNYICVFSDITEAKQHQQQLLQQAHFDPLTGLANRVLLDMRLGQAMRRARQQQHMLAVCFMDLDGFKQVNDTLGHGAGDQLLITVSQRLVDSVRGNDTVARLGGDEFVLLLSPISDLQECQRVAERILGNIAAPITLEQQLPVRITGSMGISLYPLNDSCEPAQLLELADQAMYAAKQNGSNCYIIADAGLPTQRLP